QGFLFEHGARVAKLAIEQRLPAIISFQEVARYGVLMSYGSNIIDDVRRLPYFADRVLKGAKTAELPVEQPSKFYLTINQKTAAGARRRRCSSRRTSEPRSARL